ncbi:anthranilate synthase component I [Mesobacillus maritimus]|uniref:anthranilate synthase component I n=1 Tax=Mesobacillus maritimus TaxID=1643336 RepID=UPI00203C8289|nr:anthranilate synthase component I [Mesobacillus maritimus]MCM3668400.1 anthranilate synthase component I [Mesobacillus maritimus]
MVLKHQEGIYIREIEGDILTPIAIYQKISGKKKFLFESSLKHEDTGRYSFIGSNPVYEVKGYRGHVTISGLEDEQIKHAKVLDVLKSLLPETNSVPDIPFIGGAVGYIGYDIIRDYEDIGREISDPLQMPESHLFIFDEIIVFDHLKERVFIVGISLPGISESELQQRLEKRLQELKRELVQQEEPTIELSEFHSNLSREEYEEMVLTAKKHIEAGDVFQVVLSRRLEANLTGNPFTFYRKLRVNNPSPYMYFLDFGEYSIAGASPESLVKARDGVIMTNPIAGTRPRGKTVKEDVEFEQELLKDEKELAEHRMLVDLGRNDLGRICKIGSINLEKYMNVERYQHVMHIVSEVSGELEDGCSALDGLASCLPAGTVSGAPKIRAMQIINDLEPVKRGVYSGAIGYYSACGNMDFALAIRTMVIKDSKAYIQAGAGIVYDSDPAKEFDETAHKLRALREAANDLIN